MSSIENISMGGMQRPGPSKLLKIVLMSVLTIFFISSFTWAGTHSVTVNNNTKYLAQVNFYYNLFANVKDQTLYIEPNSSRTYSPSGALCPAGLTGTMSGVYSGKTYTTIIEAADNYGLRGSGLKAGCWSSIFDIGWRDSNEYPSKWSDNLSFWFLRKNGNNL